MGTLRGSSCIRPAAGQFEEELAFRGNRGLSPRVFVLRSKHSGLGCILNPSLPVARGHHARVPSRCHHRHRIHNRDAQHNKHVSLDCLRFS